MGRRRPCPTIEVQYIGTYRKGTSEARHIHFLMATLPHCKGQCSEGKAVAKWHGGTVRPSGARYNTAPFPQASKEHFPSTTIAYQMVRF